MKYAVVIPTYNAIKGGLWEQVLTAADHQDLQDFLKIIVDSSSADDTCRLARLHGWTTIRIDRKKFNHGGTRDRICRILYKKGVECVVFLSQDVVLTHRDALRLLVEYLQKKNIAGCFGKQINNTANTLNSYQQKLCYPEHSYIKSSQNIAEDGLRAVFFSDAFAAWKLHDVIQCGGFPATDFGEDTLMARQIILHGGQIGYCAEAIALHEHKNTLPALFARGFQGGRFHRKHQEIRDLLIHTPAAQKKIPLPARTLLSFAAKALGYFTGLACPVKK